MEQPMYGYGQVPLPEHGRTLSPLGSQMRHGLTAIAVFSALSLASSVTLFSYLTWRLVRWKLFRRTPNTPPAYDSHTVDLSLGLSEQHFKKYIHNNQANRGVRTLPLRILTSETVGTTKTTFLTSQALPNRDDKRSNTVIIIVYHLLLADVLQSIALVISAYWLKHDGIFVPSPACYAQGWLLSFSKLAEAGLLGIISINTYVTLVWGYKPPHSMVYTAIGGHWLVSLAFTLGGVLGTQTGLAQGGYYTRSGAWCWINAKYDSLRLWLEYFWIFLAMALTIVCHSLVFWSLYRNKHSSRQMPPRSSWLPLTPTSMMSTPTDVSFHTAHAARNSEVFSRSSGHHPVLMLYPFLYLICVAPIAIARCVDMSKGAGTISSEYYLVAGCLIACHGFLNVVLWSFMVAFIDSSQAKDIGLDRFMRTPQHRQFGNMVWVQGGGGVDGNGNHDDVHDVPSPRKDSWLEKMTPFRSKRDYGDRRSRSFPGGGFALGGYAEPHSGSQQSLQRSTRDIQGGLSSIPAENERGIQMEVVTTLVVEEDPGHDPSSPSRIQFPPGARSAQSVRGKASIEGLHEW